MIERAAALYDIHGNLPALEAVLVEVARLEPDLIVVGGDVAAGPMPAQTIERLRGLGDGVRFIRGNADRELVDAYDSGLHALKPKSGGQAGDAVAWVSSHLERADRDFLAGFEDNAIVEIKGLGQVVFCHGSPRRDDEIITAATPDARLHEALAGVEQLVVCGHTHIQFDRQIDNKRVVNAGSIGVPYQGAAGAYWLLLGPEVALTRTAYDTADAAEEIRNTGFPSAEGMLRHLLEPMDPSSVVAFFERQAQRTA